MPGTPCDLRCTYVPSISLISPPGGLKLLGISAGQERGLVPTKSLGHIGQQPPPMAGNRYSWSWGGEERREPFPSSARAGEMQGEDSLNKARDAGGRAAEEKPPGLEGGDGLLDQGPDLRVGPVDGLLACGQRLPPAAVGNTGRAPGSLVSLVGPSVTSVRARELVFARVERSVDGDTVGPGRMVRQGSSAKKPSTSYEPKQPLGGARSCSRAVEGTRSTPTTPGPMRGTADAGTRSVARSEGGPRPGRGERAPGAHPRPARFDPDGVRDAQSRLSAGRRLLAAAVRVLTSHRRYERKREHFSAFARHRATTTHATADPLNRDGVFLGCSTSSGGDLADDVVLTLARR